MTVSSCFVRVVRGGQYLCGSGDTSSGDDTSKLKAGLFDPFLRALDGGSDGVGLEDVGLKELCRFGVFGDEGSRKLLVHVEDSDIAAGLDNVDGTGAAETRCTGEC
jgi:hypothetical protein